MKTFLWILLGLVGFVGILWLIISVVAVKTIAKASDGLNQYGNPDGSQLPQPNEFTSPFGTLVQYNPTHGGGTTPKPQGANFLL